MTATTTRTFDQPVPERLGAERPERTVARARAGERFRATAKRFIAARETAVHEAMIAGRYGPEAAAVRRRAQ